MNSFLVTHQNLAVPVIEWGGLFVLLFIILSPFLIIRHPYFKPTRWWHIVGAYIGSFIIFLIVEKIDALTSLDINNYLAHLESRLYRAYENTIFNVSVALLLIGFPLFTFYSAKLLYEKITKKIFVFSLLISIGMCVLIFIGGAYWVVSHLNFWF